MNIERNKSLINLNTFGFDVTAEYFTAVDSVDALHEAVKWCRTNSKPYLLLGGGSNIVFTRNVEGLVIHLAMKGIDSTAAGSSVSVRVAAGEPWHALVKRSVENGVFGLENLALIPGYAGAAPIQNIGAYGVEVCERLSTVEVYDVETGSEKLLTPSECSFSYRHSLFKTDAGRRYIVTAIHLALTTIDAPRITYRALTDTLAAKNLEHATGRQVFDVVCEIRRDKLPDPEQLGNVGSFFKNPVIDRQQFDTLRSEYPELPGYAESCGQYKVPAAWLIDRAGWKGKRFDCIGVHSQQALVLVNHGGGDGQQIAILADRIKKDISQRYGVLLEREPTLY